MKFKMNISHITIVCVPGRPDTIYLHTGDLPSSFPTMYPKSCACFKIKTEARYAEAYCKSNFPDVECEVIK